MRVQAISIPVSGELIQRLKFFLLQHYYFSKKMSSQFSRNTKNFSARLLLVVSGICICCNVLSLYFGSLLLISFDSLYFLYSLLRLVWQYVINLCHTALKSLSDNTSLFTKMAINHNGVPNDQEINLKYFIYRATTLLWSPTHKAANVW